MISARFAIPTDENLEENENYFSQIFQSLGNLTAFVSLGLLCIGIWKNLIMTQRIKKLSLLKYFRILSPNEIKQISYKPLLLLDTNTNIDDHNAKLFVLSYGENK